MPLPATVMSLDRELIRNQVYKTLLIWIVEGILQPDEKINDAEIAKKLGVSRTPVRESIRKLEDEGFIETSAQKWTKVARLNVDQLKELIPIIAELETLALKTIVDKGLKLDTNKLYELNEKMESSIGTGNYMNTHEYDLSFHNLIISTAANSELSKTVSNLKIKLKRIDMIFFKGNILEIDSCKEHKLIIDDYLNRDFTEAQLKLKNHWLDGIKRFEKMKNKL